MERLVYSSVAHADLETSEVFDIVETSSRNNPERGVTGFLIYDEGRFLQLLEGATEDLDVLFEIIARDERHSAVQILDRKPASERWFPDWKMKQLISFSSVPALEELRTILTDKPEGDQLLSVVTGFLDR